MRLRLSRETLAVIEKACAFPQDGFLFPSICKGVIFDATMSGMMERWSQRLSGCASAPLVLPMAVHNG